LISEKEISNTVCALYEAALKPDLWTNALTLLGNSLGCYGSDLFYWNLDTHEVAKAYTTKFPDENAMLSYMSYYAKLDPRGAYCANNRDRITFYDRDIISEDQMLRSEYFDWELKETEQRYAFGAVLTKIGDYSVALSLGRNNNAGHPSKDEDYLFHRLIPHIQRAIQVSELLNVNEISADNLLFAAEQNLSVVE